jgi:hypothetical protein
MRPDCTFFLKSCYPIPAMATGAPEQKGHQPIPERDE